MELERSKCTLLKNTSNCTDIKHLKTPLQITKRREKEKKITKVNIIEYCILHVASTSMSLANPSCERADPCAHNKRLPLGVHQ